MPLEYPAVLGNDVFQTPKRHIVVDCALLLGENDNRVVNHHRDIIVQAPIDHIFQSDRLNRHLADFEIRAVDRVVERKKVFLRVYAPTENAHEQVVLVVAFFCHICSLKAHPAFSVYIAEVFHFPATQTEKKSIFFKILTEALLCE